MFIFLSHLLAQQIRNPAIDLPFSNGTAFFNSFIPALIGLAFVIGAIVFLLMLVTGAISWITSGGDKIRLEAARSKITNALVGIVVLLGFFAILNFVECFFGFGLRQITVGPFNIGFLSQAVCPGGNTNGNENGNQNGGLPPGGSCIYPSSRCCDDVSDSTCFCQNPAYHAVSHGACNAGGGNTGVYCSCEPN